MPVRVHQFGPAGNPLPSLADEDDGAPPADPRVRVTTVDSAGEIVSEQPSEADLAAIAAKIRAAPVNEQDTAELRRFCLDLASRGGQSSPAAIIAAAKELRDFVLKG